MATGDDWPDALAAGPAAAAGNGPLLLVDGADVDGSPAAQAWFEAHRPVNQLLVAGQGSAVSEEVSAALSRLLR